MPGMSVSVQMIVMKGMSSRRLQTSDYWEYAVSRSWLESWDSSISQCLSLDGDTSFINTNTSKLVTMETDDADNVYLPESQWKMYLTMFGIDLYHERRRRPIYTLYMSLDPDRNPYGDHVIADKDLDFLPIAVGDVNDVATGNDIRRQIQVFAWDSLAYIGEQAKIALRVKKNVQVRTWLCILRSNERGTVVMEPIIDGRQSLLSKLIEFVPNLKDLMKSRNVQINPKFVVNPSDKTSAQKATAKGPELRKSLWEDVSRLFRVSSTCIAIGIEEIGFKMKVNDADKGDGVDGIDDEQNESIVMISSIQNEWEDVLTTQVEKYTENMANNIGVLKETLVESAKEIVNEKLHEINEIRDDFEKRFTMLENRESALRRKENENNEKEADIADRLSKFKKGLEDFQREKKKFADEIERIEAQNKIAQSRVTLNIGGILYTTSVETLTKEDGSLLATMFCGRHALKREPDGTYFIDRDGVNFRYILNYLRGGADSVATLPKEGKLMKELMIEAKYYRLKGLEDLLQTLQ